jgi:ATP-dependent protease HslVU (ClpYQ) peptidase subunit
MVKEPCGKYQKEFQVKFIFDEQQLENFDLKGAGAILLLTAVSSENFQAALEHSQVDLSKAAIEFSKRHPTEPNLLLSVLQRPDCEAELARLFSYQHDRIPDREFVEIMLRSFKEGIQVAIFISPVVTSVVNAVMGKGLKEVATALAGTTVAVMGLSVFRKFLQALRQHKMSPLHRDHLEAIVAVRAADEGILYPEKS